MSHKSLLRTGVIGTVVAAVCCATPALVVLLGALGLTAWLAWLDYVLLPALLIFAGLALFAFIQREKNRPAEDKEASS